MCGYWEAKYWTVCEISLYGENLQKGRRLGPPFLSQMAFVLNAFCSSYSEALLQPVISNLDLIRLDKYKVIWSESRNSFIIFINFYLT